MEKQSKKSTVPSGKGGKRPGAGRPKGSVDKGNKVIREMVAAALVGVGGVKYLQTVAKTHPPAFLALVGKTMPLQIAGDPENPLRSVSRIELVALK